jgi:hypothetical protein
LIAIWTTASSRAEAGASRQNARSASAISPALDRPEAQERRRRAARRSSPLAIEPV